MFSEEILTHLLHPICHGYNCVTNCYLRAYRSSFVAGYCVCSNIKHSDAARPEAERAILQVYRDHPELVKKLEPEYRKYLRSSATVV